jgi:hypothetical protein
MKFRSKERQQQASKIRIQKICLPRSAGNPIASVKWAKGDMLDQLSKEIEADHEVVT